MPTSYEEVDTRRLADGRDSQMVMRKGGAELVAQLLHTAASEWDIKVVGPSAQANGISHAEHLPSRLADLSCRWDPASALPSYKLIEVKQLDNKLQDFNAPSIDGVGPSEDTTLVIVGSGDSFDDAGPALRLLERLKPTRIIHYMSKPLAVGALWDLIRGGADSGRGIPAQDNVFVVVEAEDLRTQGINLSQGLSWEATSEDFVRNMGSNGRLDTLVTCPNLLVRFGNEGVIHHRGRDAVDPKLFFDPKHTEGTSQKSSTQMVS